MLNAISADQHVGQIDHDFNTKKKVTIIEKLKNTKLIKENIAKILKKCENFWIRKSRSLLS